MIEDIYLKRLILAELIVSGFSKIKGFTLEEILICKNNLNSNITVVITDNIYVVEKKSRNHIHSTVIDVVGNSLINSVSINKQQDQIVIGFVSEGVKIYNFSDDFELWGKSDIIKPSDIKLGDQFGFFVIHGFNDEIIVSAPNKSIFIENKEYKNTGAIYSCRRTKPFFSEEGNFSLYNYSCEEIPFHNKHNVKPYDLLGYHITKVNDHVEIKGINNSFIY